jgi:2-polyprenyl-3-methyl-5-hydroxy-6-metoxy-1,4-benzoquinol methylase
MQIDLTNMDAKPDGYYRATRDKMLKYVPKDVKTTLEFGCGFGGFSALLKKDLGVEAWAVEIDKEAAAEAAKKLDKVINADAHESLCKIPDDYFDCVIFLDTLEHLVDPYSLLAALKKKLTGRGVVVTSIPNVRYYRNYVDFAIKGNWDYKDAGTLDKAHLRFFTYNSILKTFDHLGFEVLLIEGIHATRNKKLRFLNILLFNALEDLKYLHFVTVTRPRTE